MVEEEGVAEKKIEESASEEHEDSENSEIIHEIEILKKEIDSRALRSEIKEIEGWKKELLETIDGLKAEINSLKQENRRMSDQIKDFTEIMVEKNEEVLAELEKKVDEGKIKLVRKDMGKMNKKMTALMEETGFGEIIDVTKIPPNILEIVYDSTLKDISLALWREYGPGAERVITDTLEKIRLETSGSEMFHYDGRYIRTRDVAKNIKRGMISAKQLQDTYDALVKTLVDFVPTYKAKNFKAMIKLKSQEYTVDKTTSLLESVEMMEERISRIDSMLSSTVSGLSAQAERISALETSLREELDKKLAERDEKIRRSTDELNKSLSNLREEYATHVSETDGKMREILDMLDEIEKRTAGITPSDEGKTEEKQELHMDLSGLNEEERFVIMAMDPRGMTYGKIRRSVAALIASPLDDILSSLIEKGLLREEKKGRSRKFYPLIDMNAVEEKGLSEPEEELEKSDDENGRDEELEKRVLDAIPDRGCTMNRLKKALGKSAKPEDIDRIVTVLLEKGTLVETTRGRYKIYMKKEEKGGEKNA